VKGDEKIGTTMRMKRRKTLGNQVKLPRARNLKDKTGKEKSPGDEYKSDPGTVKREGSK